MAQTTLFLFAHQDDEIGVLAEIEYVIASGGRPVCAYLTDGAVGAVTAARRWAESRAVLAAVGVPEMDMHPLGERRGIGDGVLVRQLAPAYEAVRSLASGLGPIERLVMHGWEGGHQDHDAVHILGVTLASEFGLVPVSRQFPLYRAPLAGKLPYTMLRPLPGNGPVEARRIAVGARLRYLRHCLQYRSQAKTFMGLLPFILADYVMNGRQMLQPVSIDRLSAPPHAGVLLYERWGRMTWRDFDACAAAFLDRHRSGAPASVGASPGGGELAG